MLGLPRAIIVDSVNEKTRAIADDSTDSAGFTCPVGMRLTALFYSIKKEHCHLEKMRVLLVSVIYRVPRMHISSLRQPGHPFIQDPWLCVTRLLWFCPFGERFLNCLNRMRCFISNVLQKSNNFFWLSKIFFVLKLTFEKLFTVLPQKTDPKCCVRLS